MTKVEEEKLTICVEYDKGHLKLTSWPIGYPSLCEECNK